MIPALILTGVLSFATSSSGQTGGRAGLTIGTAISLFCVAGVWLHAGRYLIAEIGTRAIERAYRLRHGRSSADDLGLGHKVPCEASTVMLRLTSSQDWDLVIQGLLGAAIAVALH